MKRPKTLDRLQLSLARLLIIATTNRLANAAARVLLVDQRNRNIAAHFLDHFSAQRVFQFVQRHFACIDANLGYTPQRPRRPDRPMWIRVEERQRRGARPAIVRILVWLLLLLLLRLRRILLQNRRFFVAKINANLVGDVFERIIGVFWMMIGEMIVEKSLVWHNRLANSASHVVLIDKIELDRAARIGRHHVDEFFASVCRLKASIWTRKQRQHSPPAVRNSAILLRRLPLAAAGFPATLRRRLLHRCRAALFLHFFWFDGSSSNCKISTCVNSNKKNAKRTIIAAAAAVSSPFRAIFRFHCRLR